MIDYSLVPNKQWVGRLVEFQKEINLPDLSIIKFQILSPVRDISGYFAKFINFEVYFGYFFNDYPLISTPPPLIMFQKLVVPCLFRTKE